jgi:sialic acid synthase SpsE
LKDYSEQKKLHFLCSPFSESSADALAKINIEAFKIASPELNHIPLLKYIAKFNKPMILSTGLSTISDVEEAIETCRAANPKVTLVLMHCVSSYPAHLEDCNLNVIETLKKAFNVPIGFSDHTLDVEMVDTVAVACGASVIEKHFTLDKKQDGPDHSFALIPCEFKRMVLAIREIDRIAVTNRQRFIEERFNSKKLNKVLGKTSKAITPCERSIYPCDKRSIISVAAIKRNDLFSSKNIKVLRAERNIVPGLHPRWYELLLSCRAQRNISCGKGIVWKDILVTR